jgi:PAS domain S-box-containing protein
MLLRMVLATEAIGTPYVFFTLIIFFYTWKYGFFSGLLTTVLITLTIIYFYLPPFNAFAVENRSDVIQIWVFAVESLIILVLTARITYLNKSEKLNNDKLAASGQRLKSIMDSLFTMVAVVDLDGRIIEANKAITYNPNKQKQKDTPANFITEVYAVRYSHSVKARLSTAIVEAQKGTTIHYDEKLRVGDNEFIEAQISVIPVIEKNEVVYLTISAVDITDRRNYEMQLEKIHENYSKLVNSNIIGMMISDMEGNVSEANEAFLDLIGYSREELNQGKINWIKPLQTEYFNRTLEAIEEMRERGYATPREKEIMHHDGQMVPVIIASVLIDPESENGLFIVLDISERKKLERRKDEFMSIASHELKTPLTSLKGYVQLLNQNLGKGNFDNSKFVKVMENQLDKLTDLINDLLDTTKIQAGKLALTLSQFDLNELVEEVIQETQPLIKQQKIKFKPAIKPHMIMADRFRIGQVITNFITNAIKHSEDDGEIVIETDLDRDSDLVKVKDFGEGVPEDMQAKIFDKFFQVEDDRQNWTQGLGLGLYISKEIIKRHHGQIGVQSKPGKGATFYFSIPKATPLRS